MKEARILIIDDSKSVLGALEILLQFEYKQVNTISNPNQISSYPDLDQIDIILLDMNFSAGVNSGNEGLYWLREIKKLSPETSVIMMTAYGDVPLAVQTLKEGASDFILKPWNNDKLLVTLRTVLELKRSKREINKLRQKESGLKRHINQKRQLIIGNSKAIHKVLDLTAKVAITDVNVLITGENGTGKELIARELHAKSLRAREVFISVDMGSISEQLFESELFGHIKGSFTDAKEDRVGKFEAADGGTLFLDEIGNLSLGMQAKLLSVIQNHTIVRVGSNTSIPVNIRLICATNNKLEEMVQKGTFREDLLYRINIINIQAPALRERSKDILVLADYFLKKLGSKYNKHSLRIPENTQQKLMQYNWPGNVRELQHAMERAIILCESKELQPDDFILKTYMHKAYDMEDGTLEELEEKLIIKTLEKHQDNHTITAEQLGISRQTLYNKLKKIKDRGK